MADPAPEAPRRAGRARRLLLRDEGGAVTVAFALWLPLFVTMLTAVVDVTLVYAYRANVERAALDTAHALSRREIAPGDAEAYLRGRILLGDPLGVAVEATLATNATIVVRRTQPAWAYSLFEKVVISGEDDVLARTMMLAEPG